MTNLGLSQIANRLEMIRFFDGYATERQEEINERRLKRPLVKTQLIEILNGREAVSPDRLQAIFERRQMRLNPLEDGLFLMTDIQGEEVGFLEQLHPRILALYSNMKTEDLTRWVRRIIMGSPELDYVWLSGMTFSELWKVVVQLSRSNRFTRLVFTHESIFEIDSVARETEEEQEEPADSTGDELEEVIERRATSFRLVDRIGVIQQKLGEMQRLYAPLYAISQLRFPSPVGRGGHDFYDTGRVTNRSESFRDHRAHLLFVVRIYEKLLRATEERVWYDVKDSISIPGQFRKIVGAPVVVRFLETLSTAVFNQWITATFERKRNRFRLWGHPIRLGPTKVHVYGVDRHLWQPIFLELTSRGCTAIVPNGTCGNTVHRLVTNIQKYLDPGAIAYVGDRPFGEMVRESADGVPYDIQD
ncbi:MAG: hypothetical protein AB1512_22065 [Thermodesulfobacteriota bacterium]